MKTTTLYTPAGIILYAIDESDTAHALALVSYQGRSAKIFITSLGSLPEYKKDIQLFTGTGKTKPAQISDREAEFAISRILNHNQIMMNPREA